MKLAIQYYSIISIHYFLAVTITVIMTITKTIMMISVISHVNVPLSLFAHMVVLFFGLFVCMYIFI